MEFAQVRLADVVVASVAGRVDQSNAEQFKGHLAPALSGCTASGDKLLLDLSGLEYISSAGLRVLMLAARDARTQGGTLAVCGLQPLVAEIFEISRFNVVFKVYPDREAAQRELATAAVAARVDA